MTDRELIATVATLRPTDLIPKPFTTSPGRRQLIARLVDLGVMTEPSYTTLTTKVMQDASEACARWLETHP